MQLPYSTLTAWHRAHIECLQTPDLPLIATAGNADDDLASALSRHATRAAGGGGVRNVAAVHNARKENAVCVCSRLGP